jgi:hypothetical protein
MHTSEQHKGINNLLFIHDFIDSCQGKSLEECKERSITYWNHLNAVQNKQIPFKTKEILIIEITHAMEKPNSALPKGFEITFIDVITGFNPATYNIFKYK